MATSRLRMPGLLLCAALLLPAGPVLQAAPAPAAAASALLTVRVENVSPRGGMLQLGLYDEAGYDGHDKDPVLSVTVPAQAPVTIVAFPAAPPGAYAVKAFQDADGNKEFTSSLLGLPEEPFGFSNDALPLLEQPSFQAVEFALPPGPTQIVMHLHDPF